MRINRIQKVSLAYLLCFLLSSAVLWAGGGAQNVLVVVNDGDASSQEIGQYYQDQRGIPERNVFHINIASNSTISAHSFSNDVRGPILAYIASAGLSNQIDYVVLCGRAPYIVGGNNGMSSCLFYDYKGATVECDLPANTRNDFYEYERAFEHNAEPSSNRYYISTMLAAYTLDEAKQLIDRSVAADNMHPTGVVYLANTFPNVRNARWTQHRDVEFSSRFLDRPQEHVLFDGNGFGGRPNIIGAEIGSESINPTLYDFQPGAIGDHLTSYGGCLDSTCGQTNILEWVRGGVVGSYGTVIEPCAYTQKFPHVRSHFWYARGFNMGESYMMSVRDPYKGALVGDPLCAPYATPPVVSVGGLAAGEIVSNMVDLVFTGVTTAASATVHRLDVFVDDRYVSTITNVAPSLSNEVRAVIMQTNCSYLVQLGDSLYDVVDGLAAAINSSNLGVTALARGDRIRLMQDAKGVASTNITYSVQVTNRGSMELALAAWSAGTNFAETTHAAYQRITLQGDILPGDAVTAIVTRTDGMRFTNTVIAGAGDSTTNLMTNLAHVINTDTNLQSSTGCFMKYVKGLNADDALVEGFVFSRTNHWSGYNVHLDYSESGLLATGMYSGQLTSGDDYITGRGMLFLSEGRHELIGNHTLDTTVLADGPHTLRAVAYEGTALRTQGQLMIPFQVRNHEMTCAITNPGRAASVLWGSTVTVVVEATASPGVVTQVAWYIEGKLHGVTNAAPYVRSWSTTNYGAGVVGVHAVAYSSDGDEVISAVRDVTVYRDRDADGVPDWWEYLHFGSATNALGGDDDDGDQVSNADEFAADSDPNDSNDYFRVDIEVTPTGGLARLMFSSSENRLYNVDYNDNALTNSADWMTGVTDRFWGVLGTYEWNDDGTNAPPATNAARYYRIGVHVP